MSLQDEGIKDTKASVLGTLSLSLFLGLPALQEAGCNITSRPSDKELRLLARSHGCELRGGTSSPSQVSDVCCSCQPTDSSSNQSHSDLSHCS